MLVTLTVEGNLFVVGVKGQFGARVGDPRAKTGAEGGMQGIGGGGAKIIVLYVGSMALDSWVALQKAGWKEKSESRPRGKEGYTGTREVKKNEIEKTRIEKEKIESRSTKERTKRKKRKRESENWKSG